MKVENPRAAVAAVGLAGAGVYGITQWLYPSTLPLISFLNPVTSLLFLVAAPFFIEMASRRR